MRLGRRSVVHVAADVQVVVVVAQGGDVHHVTQAVDTVEFVVGGGDLLDVFGQQEVLRAALEVFAVGIDKQHLALSLGRLAADPVGAVLLVLTQDQDAGGNTGAIEQVGRQTDHDLEQVFLNNAGADALFLAAPEQHAMGQHSGDQAFIAGDCEHVLQEHQIGFLRAQRHLAETETLLAERRVPGEAAVWVFLGMPPVDGERRVGEDAVEAAQLAALDMPRIGQGVFVLQPGRADAVQQHVHLGNRPDSAVELLAEQVGLAAVLAVLVDIFLGGNQHSARAAARVVDVVFEARLEQAHHQAYHCAWRVELAALFAGRVGEFGNQVLVGRTQQIGEFEVAVTQAYFAEMCDELAQLLVGNLALADLAGEVDMLQNAVQGSVVVLDSAQSFVQ